MSKENKVSYVLNSVKVCNCCSGEGWVPKNVITNSGLMKICPICLGEGYTK